LAAVGLKFSSDLPTFGIVAERSTSNKAKNDAINPIV